MPKAAFIALSLSITVMLAGGTAYSQALPGAVPPAPAAAPAQTAVPEPPKQVSSVTIENGKLSVDLADADLGKVMNEIAAKMNFHVVINGGVYGKKVSTKFTGISVLRGIERLLSLAHETNYLVSYDASGNVSKIELYAETPSSVISTPAAMTPYRPLPGRRYRRYVPPQPTQAVPGQPQPAAPAPRMIGQ